MCVCVCICVCVRARVHACVCVSFRHWAWPQWVFCSCCTVSSFSVENTYSMKWYKEGMEMGKINIFFNVFFYWCLYYSSLSHLSWAQSCTATVLFTIFDIYGSRCSHQEQVDATSKQTWICEPNRHYAQPKLSAVQTHRTDTEPFQHSHDCITHPTT